ncbi:hypothetical protein KOI35_40895 [Actinoplanes bogorensis]|uniref:Uncharacterized protein n=1 Tax=Paractinoplanes bogorensis TaxID=1610840 RepID=A0ABS5Z4J6_9ACTN|nr:hypothetical protein [Actinoplanes bogorensis]MBU2669888.1 hypothetical protein [Actinoplanes bogorensis]
MSVRSPLLLPALAVPFILFGCAPSSALSAPSATPSSSPASSSAPAPSSSAPVPAPSTSSRSLGPEHGSGVCPPAKEFEKLADLPEGWHFPSVKCWKSWAFAAPEGPGVGDGIYLFRYVSSKGWRYHSQGSGYMCEDLGIHEPAPFCQYP